MKYSDAREDPRRRVAEGAAAYLTRTELLAVLVGGQAARTLMEKFGSVHDLVSAAVEDLTAIPGIGESKATQIKAAIELGRRLPLEDMDERPAILAPADAASLVQYEMGTLEQEELRVMLLDTRSRLLEIVTVYRGSLNSAPVRVGEVFKAAIRRNVASIIVVHNHPSGDPSPSPDDVAVTRSLVKAGKLLDVYVSDHLVIGRGSFISLRQRGLGFS